MKRQIYAGIGLLHAGSAVAEYIWPSKIDYLEDVVMLQTGYIHMGFSDDTQNAAEWVRTGFHDMATHDAATKTGGLDASILFEWDRPENPGRAFNNTLGFMKNFYSVRSSASDLVALGVVAAIQMCDGPWIPFRTGRIDAAEAGPSGVPEPTQDIETHTEKFAKAGFNTSDMITMVACGHSLGGIHNNDFPEITGDTTPDVTHMFELDDSNAVFDNAIVTEYLDGSTDNPLVSGSNDTTNSDKRVFAADGNATMKALADPAAFQAKCADILERMINTVPSTVTLSEPMQAIDVKPYITTLALNSDGAIQFSGRIRLRITERPDNANTTLHLTYADRSGANASTIIKTTRATLIGGTSSGLYNEALAWYEFATALDAAAGISKFHVHITTPSSGEAAVADNGGGGFPIDDAVLYQEAQSCVKAAGAGASTSTSTTQEDVTLAAAVRADRADEPLTLEMAYVVPRPGAVLHGFDVRQSAFERSASANAVAEKAGYVMYAAKTQVELSNARTTFDIILGSGETESRVEFKDTRTLTDVCASL
ncbi:hypothetical protein SLS62_003317 [Diatrype stigma]|uniref:Peroxidase n=1 Tax=Diatrype stigma TaxID=117547 RepID=A0AAN9YU61_9PEZI